MKNPWTHDKVPEIPSRPSTGMRLLSLVVWACLFLAVAGLLAFSAGGMIATDSISTIVTALSVLFAIVVAIPILKKLLAISRLIFTVALLFITWLIFRLLSFQDVLWAQTVLSGDPIDAAFEIAFEAMGLFIFLNL